MMNDKYLFQSWLIPENIPDPQLYVIGINFISILFLIFLVPKKFVQRQFCRRIYFRISKHSENLLFNFCKCDLIKEVDQGQLCDRSDILTFDFTKDHLVVLGVRKKSKKISKFRKNAIFVLREFIGLTLNKIL